MEIGDWILVAAIAVSLGMGISALRQTRQLQNQQFMRQEENRQKDNRRRLLNDVTNWLVDLFTCGHQYASMDITKLREMKDVTTMKFYESDICGRIEIAYLQLKHRGKYVAKIISTLDDDNLLTIVECLMKEIQVHIDLLDKSREAYLELSDDLNEFTSFLHKDAIRVNKHPVVIHDLANKALEIATEKLSSGAY
jgi:hypothetical protein